VDGREGLAGPAAGDGQAEAALRRDLLAWYRRGARDLPWRRTRDPYAVWVSEVMLQQTRVDVATPYFLRWMERFPTLQALGEASEDDVLRVWAGLGYYSRARNLHAAARHAAAHGLPRTAEGWRELPGVGAYTAGAVASIAFGEPVPAVDGNVVRVLARLNAWPGPASSPRLRARVEAAAARLVRLVPAGAAGDWNQALMDLGATVCTPRSPRCGACPVARLCEARRRGAQDRIPGAKKAAAARVERRAFAVVERGGRLLLVRNPARGLLAGLWSLPGGPAGEPLEDAVRQQTGVSVRLEARSKAASARHQFSHRTWEMEVRRGRPVGGGLDGARDGVAWMPVAELRQHALPSAMHAALAAAGVGGSGASGSGAKGKAKTAKGSRGP
jgi:A/G-specific adenine glycosylase